MQKKANPAALLPILEFLLLYLGLGLIFEYVLKIPMGFYSIPIVVIFLVALLAACCQNRALSFDDKLTLMGQGIGDKNIVTMLLIFLAAGIFVGVVGRSSAESVAYFMLSIIPSRFAVAVLFVKLRQKFFFGKLNLLCVVVFHYFLFPLSLLVYFYYLVLLYSCGSFNLYLFTELLAYASLTDR